MRVRRVVSVVVCLSVLVSVVQGSELPVPPGSTQGLPLGAASEAPEQQSGSAEGHRPGGSTETSLRSAKRQPPRPPGAVADRLPVPALDPPKPQAQQRLTDVKMHKPERPRRGFDAKTGKELPAERTATTREYQNADGTRTRRIYNEQVHAQRPDGSWAPIELDLVTDRGGRIAPKLSPHRVSFAPTAADGNLAAVALDGAHEVAFGLRGAAAASGQVSGQRVSYKGVSPDTDLRLSATKNGLKEAIVVRSADAPTAYDFDLRLRGLTPSLDEATGDIALADTKGATRAVIPAGWMHDAKDVVSHGVRYRLSRSGQAWTLRVELDEEWLRDDDRAFPITVDPSVSTNVNGDGDDTYVTSGAPGNHSGEIELKIGKDDSGRVHASYLHFSRLAGTLPNQYIAGAALGLHNAHSATCTPKPVDVYAVGAPWSGSTLTTWPGAPLGRHLGQASFSYGRADCPDRFGAIPLNPDVVTDWTHGAPFHGLSVRAANEADTGAFKRFSSANNPNNGGTGIPYLDVKYSPQGADYRADELVLPTANREGRLKATVRNRGSATWTPSGPHKFGFTVKQGETVVWPPPGTTPPKFNVPANVGPNGSVGMDVPVPALPPGEYQVYMTMYDGNTDYKAAYDVPYGVFGMRVMNVPPTTDFQQPGNGAMVDSIRPTLYARAKDDDNWPNTGFKFKFRLCAGTPQAPADCTETPDWTNATWVPPAGKLRWSQTYYWWVQVHDNVTAGEWRGPIQLNTQVPQPEITSHLGGTPQGAPAPGLDPQVGNYGMSNTDASVATVGPNLTITRTYNSLDPRNTNAFGEGWSSRLDTELVEDNDGSGNVTVTLSSGRQVRFGQNADKTYAPPRGQNLTLTYDTSTAEYTLRDSAGSTWLFNPCGKLRRITDPSGLAQELEYDVACPNGKPVSVRNLTSGRRLNLTWTGGHITQVSTERPTASAQPLTWTYTYTGDQLASVCNPAPAPNCTRYNYQAGSHYRSVVVDDSPRAYWRLGETSSTGGAANVTARTPGADRGTYNGVTLGVTGVLAGTTDSAASFNGESSRIDLPKELTSSTITLAAELWFKTTAGGVLMSYADQPFGSATPSKLYTPVLYVGQDGHLRGGFWVPTPDGKRQITSDNVVNDGRWHHVVLSGSINTQKLYVDGVAQKDDSDPSKEDTVNGLIDHDEMPYAVIGAGKTTGWPSGNNGNYFFAGNIDEAAFYQHPLGSTAIAQHHAATRQVQQLTKMTLPQDDRIGAELTYDTVNDRVATYTDHDGRDWELDVPSRNEAVRRVVLHGPYPDYTYEYDADHGGRPTKRVQDGKARNFGYNTAGFRSEESDELGHRVTFTTDDRGNVLSRTTCRAANSCQTSYATYFVDKSKPLDPRNDRKLTESDPRSSGPNDTKYRTTYTYDDVGRLKSATYPRLTDATPNPTETWKYALGSEAADGGGTIPVGLLIEQTGRRSGQTTRFLYRSNGDLAQQTSPIGLRTRYGYDGIGRRISETQQKASGQEIGTTTFTYTPRSEIETITSPTVTNPVSGVRHTLLTRYGYDGNGNHTRTTQSDTTGGDPARTTSFTYDEHDVLVATEFPDGKEEKREYRNAGMEERVTDRAGTTWINNYDTQGRVLRRTALGERVDPQDSGAESLVLEVNSYDNAGRLKTSTDAMGRETHYTYYDDDRPATVTRKNVLQANGTRHDVVLDQREYDPAGNVTKTTAAGGRVTTMTYDPGGYLATQTFDPAGLNRTTTYTRGPDGLPAAMDRTGSAQPGRVETTKYRYDAAGNVIAEDVQPIEGDPGTVLTTTYTRDERGLVVDRTDRRRLPTTYTYDALGRMVTETGPQVDTWVRGQQQTGVKPQTTFGYSTFGQPTHTKDPNGAVTTVGYDLLGQPTSVRQPDYTPPNGQVIRAETRIGYDDLGNPTSTTDALNRETTRTYDPYGRQLTVTLPKVDDQPSTTTMRYDRNGEPLSVTDPNGASVQTTYDELGRLLTQSAVERKPQQSFFTTKFGYDDAGNQLTVTSPAGHTAESTFNAAGEQLTSKDPTGKITRYTYDNVGRPRTSTTPAGVTSRTDYDLSGHPTAVVQLTGNPPAEKRRWKTSYDPNYNLKSVTSPEGRTSTYGYDAMNRLVSQDEKVDDAKTIRTTFGYDANGNRTRFVDGNAHATDYTFTPWGLPESTIEPATAATPNAADRTWTTSYNAVGKAVRKVQPGGVTLTAEYDDQDRLEVERGTGAEAPTADKTFDYDPGGRLAAFGGPDGSTELTYDDRGNLLTTRGPAGDATFTYTAESRLATRTDAAGSSTYTYDAAGRRDSVIDGLSGLTIDYRYDTAGRLSYTAQRGAENVVKRARDYDSLSRLTGDKVTEYGPSGTASRIVHGTEYGYDLDDNVTTKKAITNNVSSSNTYGYDGVNRLKSWTPPSGTATTYEWDDAGNRTKAGSTTFTYDERNQLRTSGDTTYTYTPRGTVARAGTRTLGFDAFGQLKSDGEQYTYDSLGRVAERNGTAFKYSGLDNNVVSDGTRLTSRGVAGEPMADRGAGSTATAKLLYSDQHGDVTGRYRGLDTFGTRTFDPFGAQLGVTAAAGETPSVGYQGEWTEPSTGAVNMHARWYNPSTGAFTSRDTWKTPEIPSTAGNRHAYGTANPLGNADPSGHIPCSVLAFGPDCPRPPPGWSLPSTGQASGVIQGPSNGPGSNPGGPGTTRGMGNCKGCKSKPPPPPPPLWLQNLKNPPPRPPVGSTVPPRPSSMNSWQDGHTNLIDRSDSLADNATDITEDPVRPSDIQPQNADYQSDSEPECQPNGTFCQDIPPYVGACPEGPGKCEFEPPETGPECPPDGTFCQDIPPYVGGCGAPAGSPVCDYPNGCPPGAICHGPPILDGTCDNSGGTFACSLGTPPYTESQRRSDRDFEIRKRAEELGISPEALLELIHKAEQRANGDPWSVSICIELTTGGIWGEKAEACINFDDKGYTFSRTKKSGWLAGITASADVVFRINGGTTADKVGGPAGGWSTSFGAEAGLGAHGGVEFELPAPYRTEEGSLSLELGGGIGFEFWSHMQNESSWNSGYHYW